MSQTAVKPATRPEEIEIAGERAVCDQSGVLYFPELDLLVVSDLHLEKGAAYARRGSFVPPYDTAATLLRLQAVVAHYDPKMVISLGDSFHDGRGSADMPDVFRHRLTALMAGRDWFWVAGNHDPDAPEGLPGETVRELAIGNLVFRHEPSRVAMPGEIAGHLHPCARIVQRGRSVRRRCFASDGSRLIMPAFGSYTGSLNVLDRAYAGLFSRDAFMAYLLGTRRIYAIAGSMLRPG
ncbi:putative phosphoesterase [Mesorhizobium albiziae]|uniref:Putative phosphoesterase n=1 Tax=Neomesorhizobium albiziae TaxID=335020 RepID=A0A1I4CL02_9HYPH|nr:ligase-associated DNA damage response endonuclease PdeM [Mesorhizobium albiziae]GLS29343.1 metallophosphatase [Mesorhizobium albiziae]SFK81918.1 putative phosphoesterase [Mesorhizobium albiziae]